MIELDVPVSPPSRSIGIEPDAATTRVTAARDAIREAVRWTRTTKLS